MGKGLFKFLFNSHIYIVLRQDCKCVNIFLFEDRFLFLFGIIFSLMCCNQSPAYVSFSNACIVCAFHIVVMLLKKSLPTSVGFTWLNG